MVLVDFHTKLGEVVFYLNPSLKNDLDVLSILKGMKNLEKYLRRLKIAVSAINLDYNLNIAKIKGEDISGNLELLIDSLKNKNNGLYESLKTILNDEKLIRKIEKSSWKTFPQLIFTKPEIIKLSLTVIFGIILITLFIFTDKMP